MVNRGCMWTIRSYHLPVIRLHILNAFKGGTCKSLRVVRYHKLITKSLTLNKCETQFMFIALMKRLGTFSTAPSLIIDNAAMKQVALTKSPRLNKEETLLFWHRYLLTRIWR